MLPKSDNIKAQKYRVKSPIAEGTRSRSSPAGAIDLDIEIANFLA
jgi:hypothetical protein